MDEIKHSVSFSFKPTHRLQFPHGTSSLVRAASSSLILLLLFLSHFLPLSFSLPPVSLPASPCFSACSSSPPRLPPQLPSSPPPHRCLSIGVSVHLSIYCVSSLIFLPSLFKSPIFHSSRKKKKKKEKKKKETTHTLHRISS